ncbi:hypothetical protein EK21DRAFT_98439 [Setomelanomma holmii]|uniref:Hydantoinase n=1 Tax=Setomelanomma holmii TaxID=210430 RepID=A0A9P4LMU8_9PLEO|nr:hypothetical protein EK21DRAFT_98439 [Setomelanomma holmii]
MAPNLRIGVDVGGTNTDGVVLDLSRSKEPDKGIVAWKKLNTTKNPSNGINNVIREMFDQSSIDPNDVASVTIGTTHFINAVVEMDASRLGEVAVIRLCGQFSKDIPIGIDWPPRLRNIICKYRGLVDGGLKIDGSLIAELDSQGIKNIAIVGIFSPIDIVFKQEETAAAIVRNFYPEADVVCSKGVANIGFLERENAAILNASILSFARHSIHFFQDAVTRLGLKCPVFVTLNDGTILPASATARLPIRTFSSGSTNSMRGAGFLIGFPRQATAYSEICGVRTNFSYPDVRSIGLGGGSTVGRTKTGTLMVGPESVGYQITQKALFFGGSTPTATDYTVLADTSSSLGDRSKAEVPDLTTSLSEFKIGVKSMLEQIVDTMKTSPEDIPVVLVGGGTLISPDVLAGGSKVVKPNWSGVANAIGAATARVSGVVDSLSERAIERAVANGALRETVTIAEMEGYPFQYIANKSRIIVKAVGDFDYSRSDFEAEIPDTNGASCTWSESNAKETEPARDDSSVTQSIAFTKEYIDTYEPQVTNRVWVLSETALEFITTGCYILGTGGGGNPYQHFLRLRKSKRAGAILRVISPQDLKDDDLVACGGAKGSPQVSIEKPYDSDCVIHLEIGGGNGLQGLIIGSSTALDIPAIDGDWIGRAYPVSWQMTPVVYERKAMMVPTCISDGNGRIIVTPTELDAERALRAALSQMGYHVGCAKGPVSGENTKKWVVENTMSLAWRIGHAVALSRCTKMDDTVAESIVAEVGKIVGVERVLRMGHAYYEVIIESTSGDPSSAKERMIIPIKNGNIYAEIENASGKGEILAMVPDIVGVLDAQNGEALGTQDYRYGLPVIVLGITASEKWTSTARGLEIGGPKGFGFNNLKYKPLGRFSKPKSVIDEFNVTQ